MQAQAQSSDHSLSMGARARGQNCIRYAIKSAEYSLRGYSIAHVLRLQGGLPLRDAERGPQYRIRALSIPPPLPFPSSTFVGVGVIFHSTIYPRCVLCMRSRTAVVRSDPFVENFFLKYIYPPSYIQFARTYRPLPNFPFPPFITFIPRTIRAFELVTQHHHHHHQRCLITPVLRLGDYLLPASHLL